MTTPTDPSPSIDIMFSFDTTGSMAPAAQVRRTMRQTIQRLFREIPNPKRPAIGLLKYSCRSHNRLGLSPLAPAMSRPVLLVH